MRGWAGRALRCREAFRDGLPQRVRHAASGFRGVRGRGEKGQASVEYVLVACVFVAMCCALGSVWHVASQGRLAQLVELNASHAADEVGGVLDALLY